MSFAEELRAFSPVVVFIDDGFEQVSLDRIDADDWAALRNSDQSEWPEIREQYSFSVESPIGLKREEGELKKAWDLYKENPIGHSILDPIFGKLVATQENAIRPLKELIQFFKSDAKIRVCCYTDIQSAEADIRRSKLVFLDFYLYQQSTTEKAIEDASTFSEILSSKVETDGGQHNRFLFLISTSLPSGKDIESFRKAAKIKAAFFKPAPKDSLNRTWIEESLAKRVNRFSDLHHLASYLDTFSEQMEGVMENLRIDLEALELHDLAILDHMRLKVDGGELGKYMSWLISEALAARIRDSAPMLEASKDVNAVQRPPFHGMLSPNQVLFSWFSDITFGAPGADGEKIQFGDVFCEEPKAKFDNGNGARCTVKSMGGRRHALRRNRSLRVRRPRQPHRGRGRGRRSSRRRQSVNDTVISDLVLVIAPACDLQRAGGDYEVLCVRGKVSRRTPGLVDLIEQSTALGKDNSSGQYKNLLRRSKGGETTFLLVEWHPKKVATIVASDLQGHLKIARFNELFCQEIKEDALRHVGRVGVPVDPAFNISLGATIVYTVRKKGLIHIEIPDSDTISGVYTSGNNQNAPRIILAEEFIEYFCDAATKLDPALTDVCDRFNQARSDLLANGGEGFKLKKKQCKIADGKFTIQYVSEFVRESVENGFCGVFFYPRGSITGPPPDDAKASNTV